MTSFFITRSGASFQKPVAAESIAAMCARAFGEHTQITSITELDGGTVNNTYALTLTTMPKLILRVAPTADNPQCFRHEGRMLRREWAVQPFLAPLVQRVPRIIMADFSNQIVQCDYVFQSYIAGELWRDIHDTLRLAEKQALWQQLGQITRAIHSVPGERFGIPEPVPPFARWSDAVIDGITGTLQDMSAWHLPTDDLHTVFSQASQHRDLFDRIDTPRLLHGDLWLNNVLVERATDGATIVGVLDSGFARWGDPLADWTIMRMLLSPPAGSDMFWESYGEIDRSPAAQFRLLVYQAWTVSISLLELRRMQLPQYVPETSEMLHNVVESLQAMNVAD